MATRQELVLSVGMRYREASRGERGYILDEFTKIIGYHRNMPFAFSLLSAHGQRIREERDHAFMTTRLLMC